MKLQGDLDAAAHARNLESIKVQADMGIKVIEVQAQGEVDKIAAEGWLEAVKATGRSIGVACSGLGQQRADSSKARERALSE